MPTCRDIARLQSEALDHPLPPGKKFGLGLHLLLCHLCRRYGRQVRFLREAAREHADDLTQTVQPNFSSEARDRIKQRLRGGK